MVPSAGKLAQIKMNVYAAALPYMGYDAAGMGDTDIPVLKESGGSALSKAGVPHICANLVEADTGNPLVGQSPVVKEMPSGLRIGIIAVIGDNLLREERQAQLGVRVLPPAEALRENIEKLKGKVDLVVVLAHTNYQVAKKLASDVPGIDVILSGHRSAVLTNVERAGSAILMHCRGSGKYVGKLVLDIDAQGKISSSSGEYAPMSKELADDPQVAKLVGKYDDDYRELLKSSRSPVPMPPTTSSTGREPRRFVSAHGCFRCHVTEFGSWHKTAHAQAFESLRKDSRTTDPECVSCHTTGYKSQGGYTSEMATPNLHGVQCEACHGPGTSHARKPASGYGTVTQSTCTGCHDIGHSPDFDYKEYLSRISHQAK